MYLALSIVRSLRLEADARYGFEEPDLIRATPPPGEQFSVRLNHRKVLQQLSDEARWGAEELLPQIRQPVGVAVDRGRISALALAFARFKTTSLYPHESRGARRALVLMRLREHGQPLELPHLTCIAME